MPGEGRASLSFYVAAVNSGMTTEEMEAPRSHRRYSNPSNKGVER
jgi:hypothetical protein